MRCFVLLAMLFVATAFSDDSGPTPLIDPDRITVSGISSGAQMAHQLHIAYSDLFSGAAILSGGPFNCAEDSLLTAMSRCTSKSEGPLPVAELVAGIRAAAARGDVADAANLADDRVWLFHGSEDHTVAAEVHGATGQLYAEFIPPEQIRSVDGVPAGHVFPTSGHGHGCAELVPPFVGDCGYDAAGELLSYLYPGLQTPDPAATGALREVELPGADEAELMDTAYLLVPPDCTGGEKACALHLVLHGCAQSSEVVGMEFIEQSGYIPWALANDIVLAFPQVQKSLVAPLNPHGCWDWWGYTGSDYPWRSGRQMEALADWLKTMAAAR